MTIESLYLELILFQFLINFVSNGFFPRSRKACKPEDEGRNFLQTVDKVLAKLAGILFVNKVNYCIILVC